LRLKRLEVSVARHGLVTCSLRHKDLGYLYTQIIKLIHKGNFIELLLLVKKYLLRTMKGTCITITIYKETEIKMTKRRTGRNINFKLFLIAIQNM